MGTQRKGDKSAIHNKLIQAFSIRPTMMASFPPVKMSKKNKKTEKNMPFTAVSHKSWFIQTKADGIQGFSSSPFSRSYHEHEVGNHDQSFANLRQKIIFPFDFPPYLAL